MIEIPLKTVSGLNAREHWRAKAKRVRHERETTAWALKKTAKPLTPCRVKLTRCGPSNGLDPFDNLPSSFKGVVDEIAQWLGIDDKKSDLVSYECAQERAKKWSVRVEFFND